MITLFEDWSDNIKEDIIMFLTFCTLNSSRFYLYDVIWNKGAQQNLLAEGEMS